ncbi:aminoacyl-histidine dipeptidase [Aestuariicella hydrocarbonica]|uniref:Cytosol non-specific dipeptidase n=1 Tax=Pseudomaricurvus hydrocarbonicus TaxID=1470433 RepID=A0A9E5MMV1_9GAMM|nr:beta-Ala-His dipeptidase [Aestuariicella hydrocarbonica]NHO67164.1 aminoacyl-histidine dipeptidase [Aestuariicella hydrocarbonica]
MPTKPELYPTEPAQLWEHFYQFTQTPRISKQEEKICQYIQSLADEHGHPWIRDSVGNLVIYVPASPGFDGRPTVIIQNHVDMVTVKAEDKQHDFAHDGLDLIIEEGWLRADRTTLGADNGLGCAAALALMTSPDTQHPPLELLFTMDEETGLGGAINLDASLLSGTKLLNLDTEDWGELFVGCAGGRTWELTAPMKSEPVPDDYCGLRLDLRGLAGGHSGIQIHQQLGNANKLIGQWLYRAEKLDVRLCSMSGGVAHNVIPRSATLEVALPTERLTELTQLTQSLLERWKAYLPAADGQITLNTEACAPEHMLCPLSHRSVRQALMALPHGAQSYNSDHPADLVDLSINLAVVNVSRQQMLIETSLRYFNAQEAEGLTETLLSLAETLHLTADETISYPGWQPDFDSDLLQHVKGIYQSMHNTTPEVKAIHAGLECGILLNKMEGVEAISFGPTIRGAHSPRERLDIATVQPFWALLLQVLKTL